MSARSKKQLQILAIKAPNGKIVCQTHYDQEKLNQLAVNTPVKITIIKDPRNYQHHKKFFKLLDEALPYWQPEFKISTEAEEWLLNAYQSEIAKVLNTYLQNEQAKQSVNAMLEERKQHTLNRLRQHREDKLDYEGLKTLEGFLDYVMKKAGCYDLRPASDGGTIKERWSIAFDNMPQSVFNDVYKRCFGVIWNEILIDVFASEEELEKRMNMLLSFD